MYIGKVYLTYLFQVWHFQKCHFQKRIWLIFFMNKAILSKFFYTFEKVRLIDFAIVYVL